MDEEILEQLIKLNNRICDLRMLLFLILVSIIGITLFCL